MRRLPRRFEQRVHHFVLSTSLRCGLCTSAVRLPAASLIPPAPPPPPKASLPATPKAIPEVPAPPEAPAAPVAPGIPAVPEGTMTSTEAQQRGAQIPQRSRGDSVRERFAHSDTSRPTRAQRVDANPVSRSPPPSPPSPPPAPARAACAPPVPPPAPPHAVAMRTSIAPPAYAANVDSNAVAAEAGECGLFEALRPSLTARIEEAVRQGQATHPLKVLRTQPSRSTEGAERDMSGAKGENDLSVDSQTGTGDRETPGDWSAGFREERLHSLPMPISASLDIHHIPVELGGAEPATCSADVEPEEAAAGGVDVASSSSAVAGPAVPPHLPLEKATRDRAFPIERLPADVVRCAGTQAADSDASTAPFEAGGAARWVTVSTSPLTAHRRSITVQLREAPPTAMVALQAVAHALDAVESFCSEVVSVADTASSAPPSRVAVTWCALPHCPFFSAARSPAELTAAQREAYLVAKEEVMQRFDGTVRRFSAVACFIAVASLSAGPVVDFGAEVFFACSQRFLVPPRQPSSQNDTGLEAAAPSAQGTVGFPLTRAGFFPSTSTVATLQQLCGSQSTITWVPILHTYDAGSLQSAGLLCVGEPSADADTVHPDGLSAQVFDRSLQWSLWCEHAILRYLCRTPAQRRWALERLVWTRSFGTTICGIQTHQAAGQTVDNTWYAYAMGVLCRDEPVSTASATHRRAEGQLNTCALVRSFIKEPVCRGAAHAIQVRVSSLRRQLPTLPHQRFLAFPYQHRETWPERMQALAAAPESAGAAVFLDCSDRAAASTLELVKAHLVATAEQQARLPYLNVVLVGEEATARAVLQLLPCAAVVTSSSCFCEVSCPSVQQVRVFATSDWPVDLQQDAVVAALAYLQRRNTPHVIAAGPAPQRLVVALCSEALMIAQSSPDAAAIESAATNHLGLRLGPFALMDAYGAAAIAVMSDKETAAASAAKEKPLPVRPAALLESCARAMTHEGLLGSRCARGGFYSAAVALDGDGTAPARLLQESVVRAFVRHQPTPIEIADRLRAAVLNAACEMLAQREVQSVDDVDLLSMCALGWKEETGGMLYQIDQLGVDGIPQLTDFMARLASSGAAPHLAPHPLLASMAAQKLRFANLRESAVLPQYPPSAASGC